MPHFLIYLDSLYSSEVHFSKTGNWHFYLSYGWDTFFLSLIVWKFFLECQMRRKRINLGFGLGVPLKRKHEWRPHTKDERATIPFHVSRRIVASLSYPPFHEAGGKGEGSHPKLSFSAGIKGWGRFVLYKGKCTDNSLWDGGNLHLLMYYKVKYAPSLKKIEWVVGTPSGLFLWKILNTFTSSIGEWHAGTFPHPLFSPLLCPSRICFQPAQILSSL